MIDVCYIHLHIEICSEIVGSIKFLVEIWTDQKFKLTLSELYSS